MFTRGYSKQWSPKSQGAKIYTVEPSRMGSHATKMGKWHELTTAQKDKLRPLHSEITAHGGDKYGCLINWKPQQSRKNIKKPSIGKGLASCSRSPLQCWSSQMCIRAAARFTASPSVCWQSVAHNWSASLSPKHLNAIRTQPKWIKMNSFQTLCRYLKKRPEHAQTHQFENYPRNFGTYA